jgi:uncharacterized membrane protein
MTNRGWTVLLFKTELKNKFIKEAKNLVILFCIGVILLKIVFYKENFPFVVKVVSSFFWMFILPGFTFMYLWHNKIDFIERFIISVPISVVVVSATSYYISLMGLHAKYHLVPVPLFWVAVSCVAIAVNKEV